MVAYIIVFLQHNLARRHEPTASLVHLMSEISPFSYLKRDRKYLQETIDKGSFPCFFEQFKRLLGSQDHLPRIIPIALVQEPVLHEGKPSGLGNLRVLYKPSSPRAIIVTLNSTDITLVNNISHSDSAFAVVQAGSKRLLVGSFYHDIAKDSILIDTAKWSDLSSSVVLAGDSNGHSPLWGGTSSNSRGNLWEEFIFLNDLEICNHGNMPTFENHIGRSSIDLTLSKNILVKYWNNTGLQNGSDHYLISFTITFSPNVVERNMQNVANTNWSTFLSNLGTLPDADITTTVDLEARASLLLNHVKHAFDIACPPKKALPMRPCKWWNPSLGTLLRKKNLAAREARRYSGTMRGANAISKKISLGRLYNKHLKIAKRDSWQTFVSNLEGPGRVSSLFKSINNSESREMPLLRRGDSSWAKNGLENLSILRESHFSNSTTSFTRNFGSQTLCDNGLPRELDSFFSWEILKRAIDDLPNGKAPGPDGIRNEVIKKLPNPYLAELLRQFRFSVSSSFIPTCWLNINTVYIKKLGKEHQDCPRTYRPIGLSSVILKLCERMINWRLKCTVLADGIPKQHAFTLNRSTESAISEIVNVLEKAKANGLNAMLLSIDIQGAFDSVPFDCVRDALIEHGAELHIWKWLDYLARNRVVYTKYGGSVLLFRPLEGTTQGGVNGPDIWIVFLWSIIYIRVMRTSNSVKFADDLSAALIGRDLLVLRDLIQDCINEFNRWFTERGLTISASKSSCLVVPCNCRARLPPPVIPWRRTDSLRQRS